MCDEDATFTERARAWLKEHEPTSDQIQDAYSKMLAALSKKPEAANSDTDECLKLLVLAYGLAGGSEDDLLIRVDAKKDSAISAAPATSDIGVVGDGIDLGSLYEVASEPAVVLSPAEKRAEFLRLKAQLGTKPSSPLF
jgi:hypothetical protein